MITLAAVFIVQNLAVVEVHFLFWKMGMSRALLIAFFILIGIAVGWLLRSFIVQKAQRH
ncbi:MAG: LapA family protein [Gammaproteobacteria bacterium]|nr:LapA family protein [Gammaproteobacteria bacterium]